MGSLHPAVLIYLVLEIRGSYDYSTAIDHRRNAACFCSGSLWSGETLLPFHYFVCRRTITGTESAEWNRYGSAACAIACSAILSSGSEQPDANSSPDFRIPGKGSAPDPGRIGQTHDGRKDLGIQARTGSGLFSVILELFCLEKCLNSRTRIMPRRKRGWDYVS